MLLIKKPRSFGLHVSYARGMILMLLSSGEVRGRLEADGEWGES